MTEYSKIGEITYFYSLIFSWFSKISKRFPIGGSKTNYTPSKKTIRWISSRLMIFILRLWNLKKIPECSSRTIIEFWKNLLASTISKFEKINFLCNELVQILPYPKFFSRAFLDIFTKNKIQPFLRKVTKFYQSGQHILLSFKSLPKYHICIKLFPNTQRDIITTSPQMKMVEKSQWLRLYMKDMKGENIWQR